MSTSSRSTTEDMLCLVANLLETEEFKKQWANKLEQIDPVSSSMDFCNLPRTKVYQPLDNDYWSVNKSCKRSRVVGFNNFWAFEARTSRDCQLSSQSSQSLLHSPTHAMGLQQQPRKRRVLLEPAFAEPIIEPKKNSSNLSMNCQLSSQMYQSAQAGIKQKMNFDNTLNSYENDSNSAIECTRASSSLDSGLNSGYWSPPVSSRQSRQEIRVQELRNPRLGLSFTSNLKEFAEKPGHQTRIATYPNNYSHLEVDEEFEADCNNQRKFKKLLVNSKRKNLIENYGNTGGFEETSNFRQPEDLIDDIMPSPKNPVLSTNLAMRRSTLETNMSDFWKAPQRNDPMNRFIGDVQSLTGIVEDDHETDEPDFHVDLCPENSVLEQVEEFDLQASPASPSAASTQSDLVVLSEWSASPRMDFCSNQNSPVDLCTLEFDKLEKDNSPTKLVIGMDSTPCSDIEVTNVMNCTEKKLSGTSYQREDIHAWRSNSMPTEFKLKDAGNNHRVETHKSCQINMGSLGTQLSEKRVRYDSTSEMAMVSQPKPSPSTVAELTVDHQPTAAPANTPDPDERRIVVCPICHDLIPGSFVIHLLDSPKHLRNVDKNGLTCPVCSLSFDSPSLTIAHIVTCHRRTTIAMNAEPVNESAIASK